MCKKMTFTVTFILVLVLTVNSHAATVIWDAGGASKLWNVPENWNPDGVPTSSDEARINISDANCIIDSSVAAVCSALYVDSNSLLEMTGGSLSMDGALYVSNSNDSNSLMVMSGGVVNLGTLNNTNSGRLRVAYRGIGTLIMTGGELNVYDKVEIGRQADAVGTFYLYDGTVNFSGNSTDLELGTNGTGIVYQYGGVFNIQDNIKLTQTNTNSVARLYLYGGVMTAGNLRDPAQVFGDPLVDITEGMLILPGDYREVVNEYIDRGWIVPYGGLGLLNVTYTADPNQTTLTASNLPPELASIPSPGNRKTVSRPVILEWKPGIYAVSHDVYFGTDPNAVRDANNVAGVWQEFKGNQDANSYDPGALELGKTYYWRIDEVNNADPNSPWKGMVWQFAITDYIVVDDFESYNDIPSGQAGSNLVYMTWMDGYVDPPAVRTNGSTIGNASGPSMSTDNPHSGKQSVPLAYDNTFVTYSEVTVKMADLGISSNWAEDNLSTLSLWLSGGPNNTATEKMYVKLNNGAKVPFTGDLLQIGWQEWSIELKAFGIDLSNVTELSIGFERTTATGGSGSILIDDIRLYTSAE